MNIVFRVDASHEIGSGHVMRCLTLAKKLHQRKHQVLFINKNHKGNLNQFIADNGFFQVSLKTNLYGFTNTLMHSHWVGGSQEQDAADSIAVIKQQYGTAPDWIVVDHYGLDCNWEKLVKQQFDKSQIMVIDDLADRQHCCDILLDQTYGRSKNTYSKLLSKETKQLLGSEYALLRDEFSVSNIKILEHRETRLKSSLGRLLIMMGGTDHLNKSAKILNLVANHPGINKITVILGSTAPHKENIEQLCQSIDHASLIVGSNKVSQLLMEHDFCIGAAGTSSWERCALGLPGLIMAFADNQKVIADNLSAAGACLYLPTAFEADIISELFERLLHPETYLSMVKNSLKVCDGQGVHRTIETLENETNQKY